MKYQSNKNFSNKLLNKNLNKIYLRQINGFVVKSAEKWLVTQLITW